MGVLPNLSIPSQGVHRNLCWAAVTVGICGYLDHSQLTLQEVASDCLPFCNGDLTSHFCDVPWQLQDALGQYRHAAKPNGRALTMAEIVDQIANRQRPIGMMISYPDNVNHYCMVKGFVEVNGITEVVILDPAQSDPRDTRFRWNPFSPVRHWEHHGAILVSLPDRLAKMTGWTHKSSEAALADMLLHVRQRELPEHRDALEGAISKRRTLRVPLYRAVVPYRDFSYPESCTLFGYRWFFQTKGGMMSVDVILEEDRLISCVLHGVEITAAWLKSMRALKKRKLDPPKGWTSHFLSVPAYRLEFLLFHRTHLSQNDRAIVLDGLGRIAPRARWLSAKEMGSYIGSVAEEFHRRSSEAKRSSAAARPSQSLQGRSL